MDQSLPAASEYRLRLRQQREAAGLKPPTFADEAGDAPTEAAAEAVVDSTPVVEAGATPEPEPASDVATNDGEAPDAPDADGDDAEPGAPPQAAPRRKRGKAADRDVPEPTSEV